MRTEATRRSLFESLKTFRVGEALLYYDVHPLRRTDGPLLGVFADAEFDQTQFALDEDEVLVLYSDGFETVYHEPGADNNALKLPTQLHIERLTGLASDSWDPGAVAASVARFERELDEQAGSLHQGDDLTAMLIAPGPSVSAAAA